MDWDSDYIQNLVALAVAEDRPSAFAAALLASSAVQARVVATDDLICAGLPLVKNIYRAIRAAVEITKLVEEGSEVRRGDAILRVQGNAEAVLRGKRAALNFLSYLSSTATQTRRLADEIRGTQAKVCGPRETAPGLGLLEQHAIALGGGRANSENDVLLTTDHVRLGGGVQAALDHAHSAIALQMQLRAMTAYEAVGTEPDAMEQSAAVIQIEVQSEGELREALGSGAGYVILKNMTLEESRQCAQIVRKVRPDCAIEISGAITLANVRGYAETGADYLCCGELTRPAARVGFDLLVERGEEK